MQEGSGAAWGEPEVEEEEEADSGLAGMRFDAVEQPPEEEAEAGQQQLGLRCEWMVQTCCGQMDKKKKRRLEGHFLIVKRCWEC